MVMHSLSVADPIRKRKIKKRAADSVWGGGHHKRLTMDDPL